MPPSGFLLSDDADAERPGPRAAGAGGQEVGLVADPTSVLVLPSALSPLRRFRALAMRSEPRNVRWLPLRSPASLSPRPDRVNAAAAGEAPGFACSSWQQPAAALPGGPMIMNTPAGPCLQRRANQNTRGREGERDFLLLVSQPNSGMAADANDKSGSLVEKTPALGARGWQGWLRVSVSVSVEEVAKQQGHVA